jgi:hypothetical protein
VGGGRPAEDHQDGDSNAALTSFAYGQVHSSISGLSTPNSYA